MIETIACSNGCDRAGLEAPGVSVTPEAMLQSVQAEMAASSTSDQWENSASKWAPHEIERVIGKLDAVRDADKVSSCSWL
jgi:hypothetical protein